MPHDKKDNFKLTNSEGHNWCARYKKYANDFRTIREWWAWPFEKKVFHISKLSLNIRNNTHRKSMQTFGLAIENV